MGEEVPRCYVLGQEHDSWAAREREAGEWPPGDKMDQNEDDTPLDAVE